MGVPPKHYQLARGNQLSHKIIQFSRPSEMIWSDLIILHMSIKKLQNDNVISPRPYEKQKLRENQQRPGSHDFLSNELHTVRPAIKMENRNLLSKSFLPVLFSLEIT